MDIYQLSILLSMDHIKDNDYPNGNNNTRLENDFISLILGCTVYLRSYYTHDNNYMYVSYSCLPYNEPILAGAHKKRAQLPLNQLK